MLPAIFLLFFGAAAAQTTKPFVARADPLEAMLSSSTSSLQRRHMPMERRKAELDALYRVVDECDAVESRLESGQMQVEVRRAGTTSALLTIQCREGGAPIFANRFAVKRAALKRQSMSEEQVSAMRKCQCSGEVRREAGSIAELTLCGRLTGFVLFTNGTYMHFESVFDKETKNHSILLTSTANRREAIRVGEVNDNGQAEDEEKGVQTRRTWIMDEKSDQHRPLNYLSPTPQFYHFGFPPSIHQHHQHQPSRRPTYAFRPPPPPPITEPITTTTTEEPTTPPSTTAAPDDFGDDGLSNEWLSVHLVTDAVLLARFDGDAAMTARLAMDAFRFVRAVFLREFCLHVVLTDLTVLESTTHFDVDTDDIFDVFFNFCNWAQNTSVSGLPTTSNLAHLVIGRGSIQHVDDPVGILTTGLAITPGACNEFLAVPFGCGWSGYNGDQAQYDATVAHDTEENAPCECCGPEGQCLMQPFTFPPGIVVSHFSSCSKASVAAYVQTGTGTCLKTQPAGAEPARTCHVELSGPTCEV